MFFILTSGKTYFGHKGIYDFQKIKQKFWKQKLGTEYNYRGTEFCFVLIIQTYITSTYFVD